MTTATLTSTLTAEEWLQSAPVSRGVLGLPLRPKAVCADGYTLSIQRGLGWRSDEGCVEVAFPSAPTSELAPYAQSPGIEAYYDVPLALVERIIAAHGGILTHHKETPQ